MTDQDYMLEAMVLARRGRGFVSPNPLVGAVVVKDGAVLGRGFHARYGGAHAEANAFTSMLGPARGATLYVNLEPCNHVGKTAPCVDSILFHKIKRVVIGCLDPNPKMNGKSVERLRASGVEVEVGILEHEARELNQAYLKFAQTGLPYVTLKTAQSLDGQIADVNGTSKWITSESSRRVVHELRASLDAVLVGIGTVLADDPLLNVRDVEGRNPMRIVLDSELKISLEARLLANDPEKVIIACSDGISDGASKDKAKKIQDTGAQILLLPSLENGLDLGALLAALGELRLTSVLVEGGAKVFSSLAVQNLADRILAFIAPKIMGAGLAAFSSVPSLRPDKAISAIRTNVAELGGDMLFELVLKEY